jgi:hypothetical protein
VIKLENGHRANMRKRLTRFEWAEIRTAYASGIGLRELARTIGIPAGTILARAKREGWSKQIQSAKALAKRDDTSTAVTPFEAVSASMQQRGERHVARMAGVSERGVDHVEAMDGGAILDRVDDIEKLDKVARRTYGITDGDAQANVMANVALLGIRPERVSPEIDPSGG